MSNLIKALSELGYPEEIILLLDSENSTNIEYLDLIKTNELSPSAVIESNGSPLIYLLYNTSLLEGVNIEEQISELLAKLACRGDHAWLAVVHFGKIEAYPVGFAKDIPKVKVIEGLESNQVFIRKLESGLIDSVKTANQQYLHELLFGLLNDAAQELLSTPYFQAKSEISRYDNVISLIGRVLFTRYLADRELFNVANLDSDNSFKNKTSAIKTCKWLDNTFNGDLLPLWNKNYQSEFNRISKQSPEVYKTLTSIMLKSRKYQLSFDWANLDFKHIPVGLLSEVYEQFSHTYFVDDAKKESIHYTPRNLASILVKQSFDSLKDQSQILKVLDPSCGAGVFLVLSFKELVKRSWEKNSKRPDTKAIRKILNEQIIGLDINSHALKLSALSLYLTAIELDPHPYPVEKLKFDNLAGSTLLHVRHKGEKYPHDNPILGSLGDASPDDLKGQFDLVIGNPPWTAWSEGKEKALTKVINKNVSDFLSKRLNDDVSYENPDSVPDLPFIFKAGEWAKHGGIIAFAIHSRLLFSLKETATHARNAIFKAFKVTGILNGSALRSTKVWPGVTAPFCLFFAKNKLPQSNDCFYYVNPYFEKNLNSKGKIRIDYNDSKLISNLDVVNYPHILKTLYKGNANDLDLVGKIKSCSNMTIGKFWKLHSLESGTGFIRASGSKPAGDMAGLPWLDVTKAPPLKLVTSELELFSEDEKLYRTPSMEIYKAPLLLLKQSINNNRSNGRSLIAHEDVLYTASIYGYSASKHSKGDLVIKFLHCLSYSKLALYFYLMTSAQFSVEREKIQKYDFESLPLIDFEQLKSSQVKKIELLSNKIESGDNPWSELDNFIFQLYNIEEHEQETIKDTLNIQLPFPQNKNKAQMEVTKSEIEVFINTLFEELEPYFNITNETLIIEELQTNIENWKFIVIKNHNRNITNMKFVLEVLSKKIAEENGVSMIQIPDRQSKSLMIGFINNYRYWTPSRARSITDDLLTAFDDIFPVD